MEQVGRITTVPKWLEFEWKIKDFHALPEVDDLCISSPTFTFAGTEWYLDMYPNGTLKNNSAGYIDIFLLRQSSGSPVTLEYSISVRTVDGKKYLEKEYVNTFEDKYLAYGIQRYILKSELLLRKSDLMPSNILTIVCVVKCPNPKAAKMEQMYDDFKGLMERGDYSDTTIAVKGKEFRLHKNILTARNPFFDTMFKTDMKEKVTGIVTINDCEPEIFNSFIHFIYTGHVDNMSLDNVCDLYKVADKYQQDQLKEECLLFMTESMSVDNFCDFVILALKHDDKKLLEKTIEFFARNTKEVMFNMKWVDFLRNYPTYASEFHFKAAEAKENSL